MSGMPMMNNFPFCPQMEPSYSASSDDSSFGSPVPIYSSPAPGPAASAMEIPRSAPIPSGCGSFDEFSPSNLGTSPGSCVYTPGETYPPMDPYTPDLYSTLNPVQHTVPLGSASPFESTPLQFPINWDDVPLPEGEYPGSLTGQYQSEPQAKLPTRPFTCPNCLKTFTRAADLKRHESSVHFPVRQDCPVDDCLRKDGHGFPRRDHLVEHLRSYHHWYVPKKKGGSSRV